MAMDDDSAKKKKFVIMGVSSMLLVAMCVGVAVSVTKSNDNGGDGKIAATSKAVDEVCQPTDYKETCVSTLNNAKPNSSNPTELIKLAFDITIKSINQTIQDSSSKLKNKYKDDPMLKQAIDSCEEQMEDSIDDLKKSFDKIGSFDVTKMETYMEDLRIWLGGAVTYQQTCIDGFENTTGDAGNKMKELLKKSKELTINGLAMVSDLSSLATSFAGLGGPSSKNSTNRKLLSDDGYPSWVDGNRRKLMAANLNPNVVVALDGSGKYKTISEALTAVPKQNTAPFVIHVKAGVYKEQVSIAKQMTHVVLVGDGPTKTTITGNLNFAKGVNTYKTATVVIASEYFMAKDIGFENSAGAIGHQAVAVRASGDYAIFHNCQFDGYQDTLYAHNHRQFYRDCSISGTIDFIFGNAAAVFQNCKMIVRKPLDNQQCMVTAQGRTDKRQATGTILHNCFISGDPLYIPVKVKNKAYLGRPWKEFSKTIIMQTQIDDIIDPAGWMPWQGAFALDTLYYSEYNNKGAGSDVSKRVTWKGIVKITPNEAKTYTAGAFISGDTWIPATGVPYLSGL